MHKGVYNLPLEDNQFTTSELLYYLSRAYKSKVTGNKFTHNDIAIWTRLGKIPEIYGNHKLEYCTMSGIRVYTVYGASREDLQWMRKMQDTTTKINLQLSKRKPLRTRLYYKIARLPIPPNAIPDNWKEIGIKRNQLT